MLQLQNKILEMVAKGEALKLTTDRLCIEIEKRFPDIVPSILWVDDKGILHPLSAPSLPEDYSACIEGTPIGPMLGSCGSAAYLRMPVVVTDIETDPRWVGFRAKALGAGVKACWSSPIFNDCGRVVGTFAFYYREKRGPTDEERKVVDTCVHLCAIALERHERVLERERRAHSDALTDLPNQGSFNAILTSLASDEPGAWTLLLLDLDNLKIVNDTFGHRTGDALLRMVAMRLASAAAPHVVFRLGGDEFAVLIHDDDPVVIETTARGILHALAEPANCDGHLLVPSATIGAATLSNVNCEPEMVRRNADFALYHAKETNRGGFVSYFDGLTTAMMRREDAIRQAAEALASDRIDAFYQPVMRLDTRAIVGVEALCRMMTVNGEIVPAASFQEATSDARVASQLTRRMMRIVAADVRRWLELGVPFQHVGINVSSADFHGGQLLQELAEAFEGQGVPLSHVILEVNESIYLNQRDQVVARAINAMRAKGLRIALDDFGTGFASLTHLLTVPVDIIKVDKSFIHCLAPDGPSSAIVEGMIGIARKLGIKIVAEGVETEDQAQLLRQFGCALAQGYLYSPAVSRDEATNMLLRLSQKPGDMLRSVIPDSQHARPTHIAPGMRRRKQFPR
ncbi:MAG TPA: GGDEF domain-containing protein [Methylovirgula sp.]|nr:GGDEF domain-containing protein [Methylovirgula sp.]